MALVGEMMSVGRPDTASSLMFRPQSKLRVSQPGSPRRSQASLRPLRSKPASKYS